MFCHFLFMCEGTVRLTGWLSTLAMPFVSCSLASGVCFSNSAHKSPYKACVVTDLLPYNPPSAQDITLHCQAHTLLRHRNMLCIIKYTFPKRLLWHSVFVAICQTAQNIPLENEAWNHYLGMLRIILHWTESSQLKCMLLFFSFRLLSWLLLLNLRYNVINLWWWLILKIPHSPY